ncbi:F2J6.5 protein, related [Neospora caninum Liverpool]|uniref:F2J6.5 protein, related n=1 Tax=Neospora caninum (strain Liverpool) TaxID=572307 RepID=F0VD77_NEOCL|nr:F2J6.5 protein, related [Neospora caninum Liverpool]CBZ51592.1 F2J6.5 protein, related [Neospora caninum Liverpool]|eukprot:XP_003881625.1 F2J6.5 protein, related [Neospora caninum Liverpool]
MPAFAADEGQAALSADEEAELQEAIRLSMCEFGSALVAGERGAPGDATPRTDQRRNSREDALALNEDAELQRAIQESLLSAASPSPGAATRPALPPLDTGVARQSLPDLAWLGEHSPSSAHAAAALPLCASLAPEDDISDLLLPRSRPTQKKPRDRCKPPAAWQREEEDELAIFSRTLLPQTREGLPPSGAGGTCLRCGVSLASPLERAPRAEARAPSPASEASTDNGGEEAEGEKLSRGWGPSLRVCTACERACVRGALRSLLREGQADPDSPALRQELLAALAPLDRREVKRLVGRVFGLGASRSIGAEDIARWFNHPFLFASDAPSPPSSTSDGLLDGPPGAFGDSTFCPWGLAQFHGGPCGLLASVQCFLLRALFFSPSRAKRYSSLLQSSFSSSSSALPASTSTSSAAVQSAPAEGDRPGLRLNAECASLLPLGGTQGHALVEALAAILFQATERSHYVVALADFEASGLTLEARGPGSRAGTDEALVSAVRVLVREFDNIQDVMLFYWKFYKLLLQDAAAVLSFLFSVVLTRGVDKVLADADTPDQPLLGVYGHCNQELVNLLLLGAGTSNVWDGDKKLGTDRETGAETVLGGVRKRPIVGFLTEMEALRYCEVGDRYKHPHYPLWVLGSGNHYTTLFCRDLLAAALGALRQAEMEAQVAFKAIDQENNTFIFTQQLRPLLDLLGQAHMEAEARGAMGAADGVVLWTEFLAWYTRVIVGMKTARGPSMRRYLVELQDADLRHAQPDAFEVARLLWTRWPAATVTEIPLLPLVE